MAPTDLTPLFWPLWWFVAGEVAMCIGAFTMLGPTLIQNALHKIRATFASVGSYLDYLEHLFKRIRNALTFIFVVTSMLSAIWFPTTPKSAQPTQPSLSHARQRSLLASVKSDILPFDAHTPELEQSLSAYAHSLSTFLTKRERMSDTITELRDLQVPDWLGAGEGGDRGMIQQDIDYLVGESAVCSTSWAVLAGQHSRLLGGLSSVKHQLEEEKGGRDQAGVLDASGLKGFSASLTYVSLQNGIDRCEKATKGALQLGKSHEGITDPCMVGLARRITRDWKDVQGGQRTAKQMGTAMQKWVYKEE